MVVHLHMHKSNPDLEGRGGMCIVHVARGDVSVVGTELRF